MYAFVITADHLYDAEIEEPKDCRVGRETMQASPLRGALMRAALRAGEGRCFKLYDADRELYYEGRYVGAEHDEMAPLDWAQNYAGCTDIVYTGVIGRPA